MQNVRLKVLQGKRCLVIGSGISGIGSIQLLNHMNAEIYLFDGNKEITIEGLESKVPDGINVTCFARCLPQEIKDKIDITVLSPGVPIDQPVVMELKAAGSKIIGEIELGYMMEKGTVVGITGTNGKTTTTTLVGEIMKAHFGESKAFVVGNIGFPYTQQVVNTTKDTVTIGEISSFQLETIDTFKPYVSAILNITPDHIDRHHTMDAYIEAKENITLNQTSAEYCVLNYDNVYTRKFGEVCPAHVLFFSVTEEIENGYYLKGNDIYFKYNGMQQKIMNIYQDMNLVGLCNVENVMAALAIAQCFNIPLETTLKVIKNFKAVEHRIEFVASKDGVDYYNDSKGTNPDAAIQGIKAMHKPTILIGGGYDKYSEFDEWIESFEHKVKYLLLVGQTKEKIAICARAHGMQNIELFNSFEDCLLRATELSQPGDAVLLSPACASWGMFPNYEVRGKIFKDYVNNLKE